MSFNKKILALAIAGALPGAAFAVVNLGNSPEGTPVFAQEIPVPATLINNVGTFPLTVTTTLGTSIGAGTSKYLRFDFPGTTFSPALTAGSSVYFSKLSLPGNFVVSSIGTTPGQEYIIVELDGGIAPGPGLTLSEPISFAVPSVNTATKLPHTIQYRIYETLNQAINNPNSTPLYSDSATWYTFANGLDASCDPLDSLKIDVTEIGDLDSFIGGGNSTNLFTLNARLLDTDPVAVGIQPVLNTNGQDILLSSYLPNGSIFQMSGDFTFISGLLAGADPIDILNKRWTVGAAPGPGILVISPPPTGISVPVVLTNNGNTMVAGDYSLVVTPAAGALNTTPIDAGVCGSLAYSGSSDRVDYGLTPGAGNKQFLRVTNPTQTDGAVNVSVWNDAGLKVDFPLSAVKVGPAPGVTLPGVLSKQSSTPLIDVNAFDAAAKSVNAAFSVGTGIDGKPGKIRIEVRGAFGENLVDGNGNETEPRLKGGIYLQAINNGNYHQSH